MSYGPVDPNSAPSNEPNPPNNQPYDPNQHPYQQADSPYSPSQGTPYIPAGQNTPQNQPVYGQLPPSQDPNAWGGNPNGNQPYGQDPQEPKKSPLMWILIALAVLVLAIGGFFGVKALAGDDKEPDTVATGTATPEATPTPEETTAPQETAAPEETTVPEGESEMGDVFLYTSANGFSVEFPGEPTMQEIDDPFGGDIPMEIVAWESGDDIYQAAFGAQRAEGLTPETSVSGSAEGIGSEASNLQAIDIAGMDAMTGEAEFDGQPVWLLNALSTTDGSVYMLLQSGATRDDAFFDSLDIQK